MSNGKKLELKEKKMEKVLRKENEVKQIKTDKTCPIGYKKNPSTNSIEIDEIKAPKIRELFNTLFPEVFESGTLSGKALFEIAMKKEKYFSTAFSQFINIRSNCAYFLLFDDTSNYQLPTG